MAACGAVRPAENRSGSRLDDGGRWHVLWTTAAGTATATKQSANGDPTLCDSGFSRPPAAAVNNGAGRGVPQKLAAFERQPPFHDVAADAATPGPARIRIAPYDGLAPKFSTLLSTCGRRDGSGMFPCRLRAGAGHRGRYRLYSDLPSRMSGRPHHAVRSANGCDRSSAMAAGWRASRLSLPHSATAGIFCGRRQVRESRLQRQARGHVEQYPARLPQL